MITRPVFDAPSYIALSYSWGLETVTKPILIGKCPTSLFVSVHLWEALNRLRHPQRISTVWVDAVCINQDNLIEKAMQIQIMAQIYNQASEVRIWLGVLPGLFQHNLFQQEFFLRLCAEDSPWWTRLWIIQECAYAKACPVVMMGDKTMTLEALVGHWHAVNELVLRTVDPKNNDEPKRLIEKLLTNLEFLEMPLQAWQAQSENNGRKPSLLQLLKDTAGRQYTMPHDRVYALLSLIDEHEAARIVPDYSVSYDVVVANIATIYQKSEAWIVAGGSTLLLRDQRTPLSYDKVETHVDAWQRRLNESASKCNVNDIEKLMAVRPWVTSRFRAGVEITLSEEYLHEPLVAAAAGGHDQAVALLLSVGADPSFGKLSAGRSTTKRRLRVDYDEMSDSPLAVAASAGKSSVVIMCLDHLEQRRVCPAIYRDLLREAVEHRQVETVTLLLNRGRPHNIADYEMARMLLAAQEGKVDTMITYSGAEVSKIEEMKDVAVELAVQASQIEAVKVLLARGARLSVQTCSLESTLR